MQRSALEICRANSLPESSRFLMLPSSYRLAWWAVASKWLAAALLVWYGGILTAVLALGASSAASTFLPVPHRLFLPAFEIRLQSMGASNDSVLTLLLEAVRSARTQLHV